MLPEVKEEEGHLSAFYKVSDCLRVQPESQEDILNQIFYCYSTFLYEAEFPSGVVKVWCLRC